MFDKKWFFELEKTLRERGLDSDSKSFDEIRDMLATPKRLSPDCFAFECAYVILAGGFSQKTAKKIHSVICEKLLSGAMLLELIENIKFKKKTLDDKLNFIQKLPHIGKITANHLARNLGVDIVKYDIWIQRLGVVYAGKPEFFMRVDNGKLNTEIKKYCDDMFSHMVCVTGLPRGYIDVVLWKSAQNGLIEELKNGCKN